MPEERLRFELDQGVTVRRGPVWTAELDVAERTRPRVNCELLRAVLGRAVLCRVLGRAALGRTVLERRLRLVVERGVTVRGEKERLVRGATVLREAPRETEGRGAACEGRLKERLDRVDGRVVKPRDREVVERLALERREGATLLREREVEGRDVEGRGLERTVGRVERLRDELVDGREKLRLLDDREVDGREKLRLLLRELPARERDTELRDDELRAAELRDDELRDDELRDALRPELRPRTWASTSAVMTTKKRAAIAPAVRRYVNLTCMETPAFDKSPISVATAIIRQFRPLFEVYPSLAQGLPSSAKTLGLQCDGASSKTFKENPKNPASPGRGPPPQPPARHAFGTSPSNRLKPSASGDGDQVTTSGLLKER